MTAIYPRGVLFMPLTVHDADVARGRYPAFLETDGKIGEADAATDAVIGVIDGRDSVASGSNADVMVLGVGEIYCGVAVEAGDLLVAAATANHANRAVPRRTAGPGINQAVVDGAAADTNIAVAGLLETSEIIGVINLTDNAAVDRTTVTVAAGQIQSSGSTAAKKLLVTWRDELRVIGIALEAGSAGDVIGAMIVPQAF